MLLNSKKIAVLFKHSPWESYSGQERLDLALSASAFEHEVTLVFIWDGVYQLLKNQSPKDILRKEYTKGYLALEHYDIDSIYVHAPSLKARGLSLEDLMIEAKPLHDPDMAKIFQNQDWVI